MLLKRRLSVGRSTFRVGALLLAAFIPASLDARQPASTLIVNASVIDGTTARARNAAVRIAGDRIAELGDLTPMPGEKVVDGKGLTLAPGFIDTHSHHDRGLFEGRDLIAATSQGITTIVVGADGGSSYPLDDFFTRLQATPPSVNVASYLGHGTVRRRVMGDDFKRVATRDEVARMEALVRTEMQAGALGMSSGLEYDPGIYSDPSELIALAKVAAAMGGIGTGAFADLVLFDAVAIIDRSTTKDPTALSAGVRSVWVNGQLVFEAGKTTGTYSGRVLRRQQ